MISWWKRSVILRSKYMYRTLGPVSIQRPYTNYPVGSLSGIDYPNMPCWNFNAPDMEVVVLSCQWWLLMRIQIKTSFFIDIQNCEDQIKAKLYLISVRKMPCFFFNGVVICYKIYHSLLNDQYMSRKSGKWLGPGLTTICHLIQYWLRDNSML